MSERDTRRDELARAELASKSKSMFMNMIAHELSSPLTVIAGYLSLLNENTYGEAPERWQGPMGIITRKVDETTQLVEDLLLASHLENGEIPMQLQPVDLRRVVHDAIDRAQPRAALMNGQITLELGEEAVVAQADPAYLGRVMDNVLKNALMYGGEKPAVGVQVSNDSGAPAVRISDHGTGMKPELREKIFDQFFRGAHESHGAGLGLFISRRLIEQQHGTLQVERTVPGEGSTFLLTLPAK
jgi:signal transduction histidine kinase